MSKKKTLSTMSLKDFHGGSIPSDLVLPLAPGVLARSDPDRSVSTNWGNNLGRSDLRPRPKSSGAARNLDEKPLVFSHSAPIGLNFDEEERKPLNGVLAPHQTISNGSVHTTSPVHQDMKLANVSSMTVSNRSMSSPSLVNSSSPLRVGGGNYFAVSSQPPINNNGKHISNLDIPNGHNGQGVNNSQPNAWGVRKEVMANDETAKPSLLSGPDALSKISQASALEKVSAGMWQSKRPNQLLPHSPYSRDNGSNVLGDADVVSKRAEYNASQGSQVGNDQVAGSRTMGDGRELSKKHIGEVHIGGGSLLAQAPPPEISERLNSLLLQKTGPLETSENDSRQGYQQPVAACKVESSNELYRTLDYLKTVTNVAEGGNQMVEQAVERPKLNLKPRSQPLDQSDGRLEKDRETLFGVGRPRELVLKERGIDANSNLGMGYELSRVDTPKNEATSGRSVPSTQPKQNAENLTYEKRIGKNFERKGQQMGQGKDNQGRNGWIENRWGSRDAQKQPQDKRPELDTWRKPIQDKPTSDYASGIRHGKIVSSLDLARAFSKSVSDPAQDQNYSKRGLSGHSSQLPFSRLTDTRQLNSAPTATNR